MAIVANMSGQFPPIDVSSARSLDLGFLDSIDLGTLPELGTYDPIDEDMFTEYVDQLGNMARMDTSSDVALMPPPLSPPATAATVPLDTGLLSNAAPGSTPPTSAFATTSLLPLHSNGLSSAAVPLNGVATNGLAADGLSPNGLSNGALQPGTLPDMLPIPVTSAPVSVPLEAIQPVGMPLIPSTSAAQPAVTTSRGRRRGGRQVQSQNSNSSMDEALHHLEHEKTKRNPKQQLQNKQAQQRYRERRKQRFNELETTLSGMQEQLQHKQVEVAGLQNQNSSLQSQVNQLTELLKAREADVAEARAALEQEHSGSIASGGDEAQDGSGHERSSSGMSAAELQANRCEFTALVAEMRQLLEEQQLQNVDPSGAGLAPEVLARVKELVQKGCRSSKAVERQGGLRVLELMGREVEQMGATTCAHERARWGAILEELKLLPQQQEAMLTLRQQHLARLKAIYQQRQSLNMQAMGHMLPIPSRSDTHSRMTGGDPTLEGKMACMSISSYLNCARNTLQLDGVLDSLKENLRQEQRAFLELKMVMLHRVLSPVQTLLFVVSSAPARPDSLGLANAVAFKLGRAAEGCPKAAELLAAIAREKAEQLPQQHGSPNNSGGGASDDTHSLKSEYCNQSLRQASSQSLSQDGV